MNFCLRMVLWEGKAPTIYCKNKDSLEDTLIHNRSEDTTIKEV